MEVNQYKSYIVFLAIVYWCTFLLKTESYYVPYLVVGIVGIICFMSNFQYNVVFCKKSDKMITRSYALFLSMLITLANYNIFLNAQMPIEYAGSFFGRAYKIASAVVVFAGGYFVFYQILIFLYGWIKYSNKKKYIFSKQQCKMTEWQVFLAAWITISIFYSIIMFVAFYPGILTNDSFSQMTQLLNKSYSNHHPYWHTQIIHAMMSLGYRIFGNINAAVATYSVFSIFVMAFCFAYVIYTVFQMKHNLKLVRGVFVWYLIMPFHITYSFTMWKDVFFGAAVTVFIVGMFRIMKKIGSSLWIDYLLVLCAAFGMCLLRSNGWFAFVLSVIVFGILFWKEQRKMMFMFICVILTSFILKYPVLTALNVAQPDRIESLAIPAQQIARVVADGKELTEEQSNLLSQVVDISAIPEKYNKHHADAIKWLVRESENQDYISENKAEFIKLYLQLGLKYPQKYVEAWIDQTKGYWNSGYVSDCWKWRTEVVENSLGVERTIGLELVNRIMNQYFWIYENLPILQVFISIGFYSWLIIFSTYLNLIKKDATAFFMLIPFIMIILSLLIATPVYAEMRYAYSIFCGIPFILLISFGNYTPMQESR